MSDVPFSRNRSVERDPYRYSAGQRVLPIIFLVWRNASLEKVEKFCKRSSVQQSQFCGLARCKCQGWIRPKRLDILQIYLVLAMLLNIDLSLRCYSSLDCYLQINYYHAFYGNLDHRLPLLG